MSESAITAVSAEASKKAKAYLTVDSAYFELDAEV